MTVRKPMVAHHRASPVRPSPHPATPNVLDPLGLAAFAAGSDGRPTAVDVFCGAGGLSLGLERAGFNVLAGADSDQWAVRTHDSNLPGLSWCGDLSDPNEFLTILGAWGIKQVDLVAGGVPCQPFSRAGSSRIRDLVRNGERGAHDHRADLWSSFVSVVRALEPRAVLVENVPDLPRWNDGAVLASLYESLQDLGYSVDARIIDSFRLGVPQHRQRLILMGLRGGRTPEWPEPGLGRVTLQDAIGDLPPIPRAQRCEQLVYDTRRTKTSFQHLMRRDVPPDEAELISEHVSRDVRPDDMEAFRILGQGQTYLDLPERLRRYRSDVFTDKYKRLAWNELSRSITAHIAKDGYWYIHPEQHRTLSIREAARIQTFPDDFKFAGTPTHRYRQIGNAVPVLLGESIGRAVLEALERPSQAGRDESVREPLLAWHRSSGAWKPPWRVGDDPWLVLMGELALARSRPESAAHIFAELLTIAPRPESLARRSNAKAMLTSAGVTDGAAATLVDVATVIARDFGGQVPDDAESLRELPKVGDYVQRAVLTFAFGRKQVLVDRTTSRVATRIAAHEDARRFQLRLDLHRLAGAAGPDAPFNRALLDLGRELCRPANPDCHACPLSLSCAHGRQVTLQLELTTLSTAAEDLQGVAA
jgi:DNA (cytosine-5)-methyltransferase 1